MKEHTESGEVTPSARSQLRELLQQFKAWRDAPMTRNTETDTIRKTLNVVVCELSALLDQADADFSALQKERDLYRTLSDQRLALYQIAEKQLDMTERQRNQLQLQTATAEAEGDRLRAAHDRLLGAAADLLLALDGVEFADSTIPEQRALREALTRADAPRTQETTHDQE